MAILGQAKMYWRLATGLRGFLKEPITLEQARSIIKDRLANRERNFLIIVKRAIYENERSPYLKLLKLAGCENGDLERMVHADGIEFALRKLREEGVYLSLEEFKGRKEVVRGVKVFKFRERDFDNPFLLQHINSRTSGSRSSGTRTVFDFSHIALGQAVYTICLLDAYNALTTPVVLWRPILPGNGERKVLEYTKVGKTPVKWFSSVNRNNIKPSLTNRMGTNYIVHMGRLWGARLPNPDYVPLEEAWRVAHYIADTISRLGMCFVNTGVSNTVRICQAASERGLNIAGAKFLVGGEPITEVKRKEIEALGVNVCPRYVFVEVGYAGFGCFHPTAPDEVHLFKDSLALIQKEREVHHAGVSVNAFLFTSLLLSAPKLLFNVDIGDYGVVESRRCGCYFDELGLTDHIYNIRSYDKLTSQGMTFFGSDLIRMIEEVLPARFGGTSIDYQMVEEEDNDSSTHLSVLVSPEVGIVDEDELIRSVLSELSKGKDYLRMMADVWSQSKTLRVKRMRPITTAGGKLLPLHIQKAK